MPDYGPMPPLTATLRVDEDVRGLIHLIDCVCILPQYANREVPIFHRFAVFSELRDDVVVEKIAKCNNCGVMHRVIDVCRSDIIYGHDDVRGALNIKDIAMSLPKHIVDVLETNNCSIATWEHVKFNLEHQRWGSYVVITSEEVDGHRSGKALAFIDETRINVIPFDELINLA